MTNQKQRLNPQPIQASPPISFFSRISNHLVANFIWYLYTNLFCLALLIFLNSVSPQSLIARVFFFFLVFLTCFTAFHIFIKNLRKAFIYALFPQVIILFRLFHILNLINLSFILLIFIGLNLKQPLDTR